MYITFWDYIDKITIVFSVSNAVGSVYVRQYFNNSTKKATDEIFLKSEKMQSPHLLIWSCRVLFLLTLKLYFVFHFRVNPNFH